MRDNPWDLYETDPGFLPATNALETAWGEAKRIAPDKPSSERARLAEQYVYKVMQRWNHVGATDTEPVWVLRDRVRKHFGCAGGYL
jgi:hypothetical protein